jgi:hypothetical protein
MKHHMKYLKRIEACVLAAMFAAVLPVTAGSVATPVPSGPQVPRSVFNLPANPKEGRDPFFPNSTRPYEGVPVPGVKNVTDIHALFIQGFSGVPPHQLVIINNVTFGVGDDAEVRIPDGRIHIHCVGITGNSAVIEVGGQQHTLQYGGKP